jgi:O-antigen/teichoic acid export membrane protein
MKTDKALQNVLLRNSNELPFGFENRVMRQILLEAERKNRLSYYSAISLVSFVSLAMVATVLYVLYLFFNFNILDLFANVTIPVLEHPTTLLTNQTRPILTFSIYIALLILFLLGLDHLLRAQFRKLKKQ